MSSKSYPAFVPILLVVSLIAFSQGAFLNDGQRQALPNEESEASSLLLSPSSQPNITLLEDGKAVVASVPIGGYDYYAFPVLAISLVNVTVTAYNGSDPDLYASTMVVYPNVTNYQWSSSNPGSDMIVINKAQVGLYYIAVFGWSAGKGRGGVDYSIESQSVTVTDLD